MTDSQIPKKVTIGELLDHQITYLLPIDWVKAIHSKFSEFFSKSELAFELSELERQLFVESLASGPSVKGSTPLQKPIEVDFEPLFKELGIQFIKDTDSRDKNRNDKSSRFALAYTGWLVQQVEYWTDIDTLKKTFRDELFKSGMPEQQNFRFETLESVDQHSAGLIRQTRKLCDKWRIAHFATIEMPVPLQPAILSRECYPYPLPDGMIVYAMPDIYPFSGRGEVTEDLEVERKYTEAPHLEEWFEIARSTGKSKTRFLTLARQFQVQHFWRVLLSRHSQKIEGKKTKLKNC